MAQLVGHLGRNFKPKRGGMAQSVEHFVHIEGVVGSSPTVTTQKSGRRYESTLAGFFCVPFCVPLRVRVRGTQRVRKNRCVPVRKWGTQTPKKCVPSAGNSFTSTVRSRAVSNSARNRPRAAPSIKSPVSSSNRLLAKTGPT